MNLSELVYQVVKQTIYYEQNSSVTLNSIREYASNTSSTSFSSDYKRTLDNVFLVVNDAIQRVATLEKLPMTVIQVAYDDIEDNIIDLSSYSEEIGRVANVYYYRGNGWFNLRFSDYSKGKIKVDEYLPNVDIIYVEYYPEVAYFDFEDIALDTDNEIDNDINLADLGISNKTCSYIVLYCKGILGRDIYGEEADLWVNQAESYFLDLDNYNGSTPHFQKKVNSDYEI